MDVGVGACVPDVACGDVQVVPRLAFVSTVHTATVEGPGVGAGMTLRHATRPGRIAIHFEQDNDQRKLAAGV